MITLNIKFRIPTRPADIKRLWREKTDKEYNERRKAYWDLANAVKLELLKWKDMKESDYTNYLYPRFREAYDKVLGLKKNNP